jgi:diguanylate cyclase (GGDEF)-like protein
MLPTKLKYKVLVSFCLMSLLPILAGVYVASLFIKFPFEADQTSLTTVSLVSLFSLLLSFLGFCITKQMTAPITNASSMAQNMAEGKWDEPVQVDTSQDTADEIKDLTRSLVTISKNAKELLEKVEKLSLKDKLTGLYNATYIRERLDEEIQRAIHYQRPCSFAYILIQGLEVFETVRGETKAEEVLRAIAKVFSNHMHEFDRAARIGRGEFVIIFPDANKKKSIEIVEKICQEISVSPFQVNERLIACAGISENPIDGVQADGLYIKAQDRMRTAKNEKKLLEAFA